MSAATALVDLERSTVHATVEIAAPPARVFRALTLPNQLAAWWGSPDMYRTEDWQLDLRPGGAWRCKAIGLDGGVSTVEGVFETIEAPHRLVMTWRPSWDDFAVTTITYELIATAGGTKVQVTHSGFASASSCQGHADGWLRVLDWLATKILAISD
ncbi:SRPBCC family protein [Nannocystaceae bacterium ST9]